MQGEGALAEPIRRPILAFRGQQGLAPEFVSTDAIAMSNAVRRQFERRHTVRGAYSKPSAKMSPVDGVQAAASYSPGVPISPLLAAVEP